MFIKEVKVFHPRNSLNDSGPFEINSEFISDKMFNTTRYCTQAKCQINSRDSFQTIRLYLFNQTPIRY